LRARRQYHADTLDEKDAMALRSEVTQPSRAGRAPRPRGALALREMLSLEELRQCIDKGSIDTVGTAFTDVQVGRIV
jgi:hypothetical protein